MATPRRWSFRNAVGSPIELWLSVVCMVGVAAFVTRPTASPIHQLVSPWDAIWAIVYGVAGVCIFVGLVRARSANIEVAGLSLMVCGIAVQLVVFASLGVSTLTGTWGTIVSLGGLGLAIVWRISTIVRISRSLPDAR